MKCSKADAFCSGVGGAVYAIVTGFGLLNDDEGAKCWPNLDVSESGPLLCRIPEMVCVPFDFDDNGSDVKFNLQRRE